MTKSHVLKLFKVKYTVFAFTIALLGIVGLAGCTFEDAESIGRTHLILDSANYTIINVNEPVNDTDAATKGYVDDAITAIPPEDATYWEEICTPANQCGVLVGEAPPVANCQSGFIYLFPDVAAAMDESFVHFTVQLPHAYLEGTDIKVKVRFIFNSDQVNTNIRWKLGYSWANKGEAFPVVASSWVVTDPSNNDSLVNNEAEFTAISGTGKEISSTLLCYVSRNSSAVTDNYTDTAIFVSANVLFETDGRGSENENSK